MLRRTILKICKIPSSVKSGGRLLQKFTKEQGDSFHANWQSLTEDFSMGLFWFFIKAQTTESTTLLTVKL